MRNILKGFEIIQLMPQKTPARIKKNPVSRKSYTEMEVLDLGKRYVRYAQPGYCPLGHEDCFT